MINKVAAQRGGGVFSIGNQLLRGQVLRVIPVDAKENTSGGSYVQYEVALENGRGGVSSVFARRMSSVYGANDYEEEILEPAEFAFKGANDNTNNFGNRNGAIVVVSFLNGNINDPVILGSIAHPKKPGAKKDDGVRYVKLFRGVKVEINKDGEWSVTYQSPFGPDGKLKAEDTGPSFIKLDKTGSLDINLKKGTIKQKHDVVSEKTDFEYKTGLKVTYDGKGDKVTFTTKGGTKVEIDGTKKVTVTAGSSIVTIKDGKIELSGDLVDVGTGASALAALGPQLISWLTSHTHLYNPGPGSPTPSQPPTTPPPTSLLSKSVKLKD